MRITRRPGPPAPKKSEAAAKGSGRRRSSRFEAQKKSAPEEAAVPPPVTAAHALIEVSDTDSGERGGPDDGALKRVEHPPGRVNLPGGVEDAFDPKLPVIERIVEQKVERRFRPDAVDRQRTWTQGRVRVTETTSDGQQALLLEKQQGDTKTSQLFIKGTENTVLTRATLGHDGTVHEERELWDSNGKAIGAGGKAKLLSRTVTDRVFASDGRVRHVHREGPDHTDDFTRRVCCGSRRSSVGRRTFSASAR